MTTHRKGLFVLSALAAALALLVSGYSLIDQGVYEPTTPLKMLPGAASQDLLSVVAALGLLVCMVLIRRGKERIWLIWVGLLGYLFYAYALYSFDRVYNPLYLCYIAIVSLCVYAIISFFMRANLDSIQPVAGRMPPRKSTAVLFLVLVAMFLALWLSTLVPAMRDRVVPDGASIFVLDLTFFLPLLAIEAVLLFKKRPLGDALAIPILIKVGTLGLSVLVGTLFMPLFNLPLDGPSVFIYALLGLGPLTLVVPFWRAMQTGETG